MRNTTSKAHEAYLNGLYADVYSIEDAAEQFAYMANPSRGKHTTIAAIRSAAANSRLGTLLRKYDIIAFNVSKSDRA